MPQVAPPPPPEVRVRSAAEARELAAQGWPTALVAVVEHPELVVARPAGVAVGGHLVLPFADVTAAADGPVVQPEHAERLVAFARALPADSRVLLHCAAGISRSPACALGVRVACGMAPGAALHEVLADRPIARPNPLVVATLDEVLQQRGALWASYLRWATQQDWWSHELPLRGPFSAADIRRRLAGSRP